MAFCMRRDSRATRFACDAIRMQRDSHATRFACDTICMQRDLTCDAICVSPEAKIPVKYCPSWASFEVKHCPLFPLPLLLMVPPPAAVVLFIAIGRGIAAPSLPRLHFGGCCYFWGYGDTVGCYHLDGTEWPDVWECIECGWFFDTHEMIFGRAST